MRITGRQLKQIIREEITRSRSRLLETEEVSDEYFSRLEIAYGMLAQSKKFKFMVKPGAMNGEIVFIVTARPNMAGYMQDDYYDKLQMMAPQMESELKVAADELRGDVIPVTLDQAKKAIADHKTYAGDTYGSRPDFSDEFFTNSGPLFALTTGLPAKDPGVAGMLRRALAAFR